MARNSTAKEKRYGGANVGFEQTLWLAAEYLLNFCFGFRISDFEFPRRGGIEADLGEEHADSFHRDLHINLIR